LTDLSHPWEPEPKAEADLLETEEISDGMPDFEEEEEEEAAPTSILQLADEVGAKIQDSIQKRAQETMYLPESVRAELAKLPLFDDKRPRKYSEEMASAILKLRAAGWSVMRIEALEEMPHRVSIWEWRRDFPAFGAAFEQLYLDYLDAQAEESIPIADNPSTAGGNVKRDKLRVETRLSVAGRRHPTRWGEQSTGNATTVIIQAAIFEKKSDLQILSNVKRKEE
jgi:hypothetical protein